MGQFIYTICSVILYLVVVMILNIYRLKRNNKIDNLGIQFENMCAMFFLLAQLNSRFVSVIQYSILVAIYLVGMCFVVVLLEIMDRKNKK